MEIFAHVLSCLSDDATISDNTGYQQLHLQHNICGNGMDLYDSQHNLVNHVESNSSGGQNIYDSQHNLLGTTNHNAHGGTDMHNNIGAVVGYSQPNFLGGVDFHNNIGQTIASTSHQAGLNSEQWKVGDPSFNVQLANQMNKFWSS